MIRLATFGLVLAFALQAVADEDRVPPVTHPATQEECGACHMAYQPVFLPARSWRAIMAGLDDHFGENAQLDPTTRDEIEDYLLSNAAPRIRGVPEDVTPLKISDLPWFKREHDREVSPRMMEKAKTMSNCVACHRRAERGVYEDD